MTSRISTLVVCALMSIALLAGMVSAASLSITNVTSPASIVHNAGSFVVSFNLSNTGTAANITFTPNVTAGSATIAPLATFQLNTNQSNIISTTVTFPKYQTGSLSGTITADPSGQGGPQTASFSVPINATSTLDIARIQDTSHAQNGTLNVTNTGNTVLSAIGLSTRGAFNVSFSSNNFALSPGQSQVVTLVPTTTTTLLFGMNSMTVTARDANSGAQDTETFTIPEGFCRPAAKGTNLTLSGVDISNSGEDDDVWKSLDEVTVEVDVDNVGADEVKNVQVKLGLIDATGKDVSGKLDFTNKDEEKYDIGDLDNGDDDTAKFEFKVPADFDTGRYKLVFKTFSSKDGESVLCADSVSQNIVEEIEVQNEDDEGKFIAFDKVKFSPTEATCGDTVLLSFDTVNIGEDDEDQVKVSVFNKELGVDSSVEIKQGLDQGDKQATSFSFTVPENLADKTYYVDVTAEYDYRNGLYRQNSDDPMKEGIRVFGCTSSASSGTVAFLAASLESDVVPGKDMLVSILVKNTAAQSGTFILDVKGYSDWATLTSLSDRIFTLASGESKSVDLRMKPNDDAKGEQTFNLEVKSGDKVQTKQVVVDVGGVVASNSLSSLFQNNKLAWVIGIVNAILIILIIVVAVKVSRRS